MKAQRAGYSAKQAALLLEMPVSRVYAYVRSGFLKPSATGAGGMRFSFRDLVLLRTAKGLCDARVAPARVRRALSGLRRQLPQGRPLTAVTISAEAGRVVVRDGRAKWNPESGQALFDFAVRELERKVAPLAEASAQRAHAERHRSAEDWFELALELEPVAADDATDAYRHALELDPSFADAWVNLGRLRHELGRRADAERCWRRALELRPEDVVALCNLGLVLGERRRDEDALAVFAKALALDPSSADAHHGAAGACERLGRRAAALRHLRAYRRLVS